MRISDCAASGTSTIQTERPRGCRATGTGTGAARTALPFQEPKASSSLARRTCDVTSPAAMRVTLPGSK